MRSLFWLLLTSSALIAQVEINGTLVDGTDKGAGKAEVVQIVRIAQTMEVLAAIQTVNGAFSFNVDVKAGDSLLVQAIKGRAIYSQPVADLKAPIAITVYDNAEEVEIEAQLGTLALYTVGNTVEVGAFYNLDNKSAPPKTLDKTPYTFSFPVTTGYKSIEASTRRGQTPLRQQLDVSNGIASISYPLRPGRTQLMIRSIYAYDPQGTTIPFRLLPNQKNMNVLVIPYTVTLTTPGAEFVSKDEKQNVNLYEWTPGKVQDVLNLELKGTSADPAQMEQEQEQQPSANQAHAKKDEFKSRPNALDPYRWYIAGGSLALLLSLAFWASRRA